MALCVHLTNFGIENAIPFQVTIEGCTVTDIHVTHPADLFIEYQVSAEAHTAPLPDVYLTPPDCG